MIKDIHRSYGAFQDIKLKKFTYFQSGDDRFCACASGCGFSHWYRLRDLQPRSSNVFPNPSAFQNKLWVEKDQRI
jgi:hypothetical protein